MNNNKIILISGPSGVGKDSLMNSLKEFPELGLEYSISMTTRKPRKGEVNNKDYYFVSEKEFKKYIENDEMLEWNEFCGKYYGTRHSEIKRILSSNKNVLIEVDVNGAKQIFDHYENDNSNLISIFILPPKIKELKKRLKNRGTENKCVIKNRVKQAKGEIKLKDLYKHNVVNDDFDKALKEIKSILKNEYEK